MRKILALCLTLISAPAIAAPFLLSDPWPLTDAAGNPAQQPDTCQAVDGAATLPLTLITTGGQKSIKDDLAGTTSGTHNYVVTCSNMWGSSSAVNFPFAAGAPTVPAGLRVAP